MEPRTKNEKEVARLSHSLSVRKSDMDWIERKHTKGTNEYFAIYERKSDWQVIRMFMYRAYSKSREVLHEPLRYWFNSKGQSVIEAKNRQCLGNYYLDAWCLASDLAIRSGGGRRDLRRLYCDHMRIHSLIPELKRTGFKADSCTKSLMQYWIVKQLLTNSRIETFYKLHQDLLTWKFYHYDELTETLWQSIRIALRHGYHWKHREEMNDWCDMIKDLEYLGLDTRNPHYICPTDLKEAHQHWIERASMKRSIARLDEMRKIVEAYEPTFYENRHHFFDMVFTDGEICIKAIPTAMGIKEEGEAMHHCVGGYYNRPNSLILSATINGKRIETIEVSLINYTLVQSRGLQNKSTEYHWRIVDLVNKNLDIIRMLDFDHKDIEQKKLKELKEAV